ncbi:hypothetical protein CRUP_017726 [Coryphaenoides rupestris]|nr:hypothetical protein CRUP_017726 [Coryphaenoides rupestris]
MHPVVAGSGATASRRSEAAHHNLEQADKAGGPFQLPNHGPATPKAGTGNGPSLGVSQNLKKARLLRSGVWNEPVNPRVSPPSAELNGQGGGLQNGSQEGSPHAGESTLLASLLQSFSSRLQSVALSQHTNKPPSECSPPPTKAPATEKEPLPVYGTASSRLKGLMRKNKLQNHSNTPYSRRGHNQDRPPESPRSAHSATPPSAPVSTETVSCTERLKAVANMVKIRSSPAPSPKPSVACSQLALLLSSEAHLQQYSREHALKAQLSGRSASERLAAMATQQLGQGKRPTSAGETPPAAQDALSPLTAQNGKTSTNTATATLPRMAHSCPQSPSLLRSRSQSQTSPPPVAPGVSHPATQSQPPREKRGFDSRPMRPPQTCSSLLLLLLNNHNSQKQLTKNGHLEESCGLLPPSGSSSVTSDSECSTQERSVAKDSSDAESTYSSCSPIDLSMRGRANAHAAGYKVNTTTTTSSSSSSLSSASAVFSSNPAAFSPPPSAHCSSVTFSSPATVVPSASSSFSSPSSSYNTSSLDKLTETLINKWKPEPSGPQGPKCKEPDVNPDLKSHSKVTLMQLLLERRNTDNKGPRCAANEDFPLDVTMATMSRGTADELLPWDEARTKSPLDMLGAAAQSRCSLSRDPNSSLSLHSSPSPHIQSSPLDLCKSKSFPAEKAPEPAFSASKLLQNLAQCGTGSPSPPVPLSKVQGHDVDVGKPLALLERLNAPIHRNTTTPLSERPSGSGTPFSRNEASPPSSQIENLLERRTVLQLLLGTGTTAAAAATLHRKDRPVTGGAPRTVEWPGMSFEKSLGPSVICDSSAVDIKVKTETEEEVVQSPATSVDSAARKRRGGHDKNSPTPDPPHDFKTEPRPAEVIAKYGLLSQLLKQQNATYYSSAGVQTETQPKPVKEEQRDYQGPSPKKRRLFPDLADSLHSIRSPRAVDSGDGGNPHHSAFQEDPPQQRRPKEEEALSGSPPSEYLAREGRGFNVLKQLLLSDNCLKELSQQPRGAPSPSVLQTNGKANGSALSQPAHNNNNNNNNNNNHNHSFLHSPWHPHGSLSSGLPGNLRALPTPPACDSPLRSPWGRNVSHLSPWQVPPKRDAPTLVKQESESPSRWAGQEEEAEGCDSNPDSPRLTRSNPILYYMLQKGSAQLRKEAREQTEGNLPVVRVKEEPISDVHAYEHKLSSAPHSPSHNAKHSHKSQRLSQSSE